MTRPALTTSDRPQKAESNASNKKNKRKESSMSSLKDSVSGKLFKNLNQDEKDQLLELLALRAGLIDPE